MIWTKNKNGPTIFDNKSIYEIQQRSLILVTDTQMDELVERGKDEQAQSNMPLQRFSKFGA